MKSRSILTITNSNREESGAMLIMAYLCIIVFLFIAILMLDVPYMERVGRSMQNSVDTASLAGAVQLTLKASNDLLGNPNYDERQRGWIRSKRAVFAALKSNSIAGAENINFSTATPIAGAQDPMDLTDSRYYSYEVYDLSGRGTLTITRGVYHRPRSHTSTPSITTFYPVENRTPIGNSLYVETAPTGASQTRYRCIAKTTPDSPKHVHPAGITHHYEPSECLDFPVGHASHNPAINTPQTSGQPLLDVADAVQVTLNISQVPTLFAKLIGVNSYGNMTRTAVSVPE